MSSLSEQLRRSRRSSEEAAQQLEESEGRLRLFIEHAPAAIAMFDRELRYLAASRRYLEDYRLQDGSIVGEHIQVILRILRSQALNSALMFR